MTFYGERFRRDDEEDIWEELKRILIKRGKSMQKF